MKFISDSLHGLGYKVVGFDRIDADQDDKIDYIYKKLNLTNPKETETAFFELQNLKIQPNILIIILRMFQILLEKIGLELLF